MANKTPERFNLFNPAFCGMVIASAVSGYLKQAEKGMPYPLIFLVLPTVLHEEMRASIPRSGRITLHAWLQSKGYLKIGFPERCKDFHDIASDAFAFLVQRRVVEIFEGSITNQEELKKPKDMFFSQEMMEILKTAEILGKLFAGSGSTGTTFSMFGVKP